VLDQLFDQNQQRLSLEQNKEHLTKDSEFFTNDRIGAAQPLDRLHLTQVAHTPVRGLS